jgi:hypothetical protein
MFLIGSRVELSDLRVTLRVLLGGIDRTRRRLPPPGAIAHSAKTLLIGRLANILRDAGYPINRRPTGPLCALAALLLIEAEPTKPPPAEETPDQAKERAEKKAKNDERITAAARMAVGLALENLKIPTD